MNSNIRGHSTTTWTKVYPILTNFSPRVDSYGNFTYPLFMWPKLNFLLTNSSFPRGYWKDPFSCLYPINYLVWCYKISPNCLKGWAPSQNTVPPSARPISSFWKRGGIYGMIRTFRLHTSTTYSLNLKLVEHSFWKDDFLTRIFVSTTCLFILILQSKLKSSLVLKFYRSMANGHG